MIKNLSFLLVLVILLFSCDDSMNLKRQDGSHFIKYYGSEGDQKGCDLVIVDDAVYMVGTNSTNNPDSLKNLYVVKTDLNGNTIWKHSYGTEFPDEGRAIDADSNGNIYIAGNTTTGVGLQVITVVKLASSGAVLAQATIQELESDGIKRSIESVNDISLNPDGELLVAGYSNTAHPTYGGLGVNKFYFPRLTADLQESPIVFEKIFGYSGGAEGTDSRIESAFSSGPGEYLFIGSTSADFNGDNLGKFNLLKFSINLSNSVGTPAYSRQSEDHFGSDFSINGDWITALGYSNINDQNELFISSFPSSLTGADLQVFSLNTGLNIRSASIHQFNDAFIITGTKVNGEDTDIYMASINGFGNINWSKTFGGGQNDVPGKAIAFNDKLYMVGTVSLDKQEKMCLIKTNSKGELN